MRYLTVQTTSLWTPCFLFGFSLPLSLCQFLSLLWSTLLSETSLTATSLGHRGEQGAAVRFHPEAAEREEPLPAGHQPLGPAAVPPTPELQQAQVSIQDRCSEGGDGGRGARNKALEGATNTGAGWSLMKLEENTVSASENKDE